MPREGSQVMVRNSRGGEAPAARDTLGLVCPPLPCSWPVCCGHRGSANPPSLTVAPPAWRLSGRGAHLPHLRAEGLGQVAPRDGGREAELSPARAGRLNSRQCREVVLFPLGNLETAPAQLAFEKFLIISPLLLPGEFCDSLVDGWSQLFLPALLSRASTREGSPLPGMGHSYPGPESEPNSLQQWGMLGH